MTDDEKILNDQLALIAFDIESNIEHWEIVKDYAERLAKLMKERDDYYFEILKEKIEHERKLRKINQERKEKSDWRLLFIILYFILKMQEADAEEYAGKHDADFEELRNGAPAIIYNGY